MSAQPSSESHIPALDGIRGIAALSVVIFHMGLFYSFVPLPKANLAVELFFILSGFVIHYAYEQRMKAGLGAIEFLKLRLCRLYPMHMIGLLMGAAVFTWLYHTSLSPVPYGTLLKSTILNAFYIPNFDEYDSRWGGYAMQSSFMLNIPIWSLSFEMMVSILYIGLVKCTVQTLKKLWVVSGFLLIVFSNEVAGSFQAFFGYGIARCIYPFITGIFLCIYYKSAKAGLKPSLPVWTMLIVIAPYIKAFELYQLFYLSYVFFLAPFCIWLAVWHIRCEEGIGARISRYLGRISYPVYCIHWPIFIFMGTYDISSKPTLDAQGLCVAFIAIMFTAHVLAMYVELPLRRSFGKVLRVKRPVIPDEA